MSLFVKDLSKVYFQRESKIQVLNALNLQIYDNEIVAIVGESGSGKSTLLSLLAGLEYPDKGEIVISNKNITSLSEEELTQFRAENISIVFQQYHLIQHLTALENVMLPLEIQKKSNGMELAMSSLQEVGMNDRINHLPAQLSGGESQRVAIARALVTKPKVLLADEPSGNLDIKTGEKVMNYFFSIVKKYHIATILVTHSEALAQQCDHVYKLNNGKLDQVK